ncbi:MAG: DUF3788 family protein [Rudaea sp.]
MAISAFADENHRPDFDEVCSVLGSRQSLWVRLNQFMLDYYGLPGEWKFYGKSYGWIVWFRKGGRTLVAFYPQPEGLVAQIVLSAEQVPAAMVLRLGPKTRHLLEATPQVHDGRWLFIPVRTERDAGDVEQLVLLKARPVRSDRSPGATRGRTSA